MVVSSPFEEKVVVKSLVSVAVPEIVKGSLMSDSLTASVVSVMTEEADSSIEFESTVIDIF